METGKVTCPIGLEAIIEEVAKIMKESLGRLTMSIDLSRSDSCDAPWLNVYVHDERKKSRSKNKCDSFRFDSDKDPFFSKRRNDGSWRRMLKYIEKVRL